MLVLLALPAQAGRIDPNHLPAPGTYIWVGQQRLHLNCSGYGSPTVVLEAGLGGTSLEWALVQPAISKITRVCSYDRAGYGWSDAGPPPRTSSVIVDELAQLLGYGSVAAPYIMVGHSFGGLGVRLFAQRFPQRIAGLVMIDSTHEQQFLTNDADGSPKSHKTLLPRGNRAFVIGNHTQIPAALPAHLHDTARALAIIPDAIRTLYNELRHLKDSAAQLHRLPADALAHLPLTVIAHNSPARAKTPRAKRFASHWLRLQRELASRSRHGRLLIAEHSGHHVHLEQPQLVIGAIRDMINHTRRAAVARWQ